MDTTNVPPAAPATPEKKRLALPKFVSVRTIIWVLAVLLVLGLGYYFKGLFLAATVDGTPISRFAVISELEQQSGREALDALITKALIENEAKKKGVEVTTQEIDDQVKKVEDEVTKQGSGSLDEMLEAQGLTREEFRDQVELQKIAEKLIADKIQVTDEEVNQYITDNGTALEAGREEEQKNQLRDGLKQQKFSKEIAAWIDDARSKASIREFVTY